MTRHALASRLLRSCALLALLAPAASSSFQDRPAAAQGSERVEAARTAILDVARRYASFRWKATPENVLHGEDPSGVWVDTPDVSFHADGWEPDGQEYVGMPYCWGGFTSIEEFERGLAQGLYAGHVPSSERAMPSRRAMGLDCSGFVARCWDLPLKQSTRSIGALSYELASFDELRPGDVVNKFDSHVALFVEFVDEDRTRFRVTEAARLKVEESVYVVEEASSSGYVPMRYKPLDPRWVPMDCGDPAFTLDAGAEAGRFRGDGSELELGTLTNPLADAAPLEWARYAATDARLPDSALSTTRLVARTDGGQVETQAALSIDGRLLMTGARRRTDAAFVDTLVDFAGFAEPLRDLEPVVSSVERGNFELGGRSFPARRVSVYLEGSLLMRHALYPATLSIEAVHSDEVPMHGVLAAEYELRVEYGTNSAGEEIVGESRKTFALSSFGVAPSGR